MSPHDLEHLSVLLGSRPAAQTLLERTTLSHLATATLGELSQLLPIPKARRLHAAMRLGTSALTPARAESLDTPEKAYAHLFPYFAGRDTECMVVVACDVRCQPLHTEVAAVGGACSVSFRAADVLVPAVRHRATGLLIAHNHPSQDPKPSETDYHLTRNLRQACELLHIPLIDHLVVAGTRFKSVRDELKKRGDDWDRGALHG